MSFSLEGDIIQFCLISVLREPNVIVLRLGRYGENMRRNYEGNFCLTVRHGQTHHQNWTECVMEMTHSNQHFNNDVTWGITQRKGVSFLGDPPKANGSYCKFKHYWHTSTRPYKKNCSTKLNPAYVRIELIIVFYWELISSCHKCVCVVHTLTFKSCG